MTVHDATIRRPDLRGDAPEALRALAALTRSAVLDHGLAELVKVRVSQLNGCAFCVDLHVREALKAGVDARRLHALAVWREGPFFDERERAALAFAEAFTLLPSGPVPDEVYAAAARHLPGAELTGLLMTVTAINAWNRVKIATDEQPEPSVSGEPPATGISTAS